MTAIKRSDFVIRHGAYFGTVHDRIDRWYLDRLDSDLIDHTGAGFRTERDAEARIAQLLEEADLWDAYEEALSARGPQQG